MKHLTQSRASHRVIVVLLTLVVTLAMTITSFADVTLTSSWSDDFSASSKAAPNVNLKGSSSYEILLNLMYPIGSYYETSDVSFNPNVAWGGTWQKEPAGLVHIGAGSTYKIGSTGGEATHKLTVAEMPSHRHQEYYYWSGSGSVGGNWKVNMVNTGNGGYGTWTHSSGLTDVGATGGDQPHNNMQPYIAVNRWRRVE